MPAEFSSFEAIGFNLVTCFLFFLLLAGLCGSIIAVVTERLFAVRGKVFYDKCAQQIARMTLWLVGIAFALGVIATLTLGFNLSPELFEPPFGRAMPFLLVLPVLCFILTFIYYRSWKALRKARMLHVLIGLAAGVLALGTLFQLLLFVRGLLLPLPGLSADAGVAEVGRAMIRDLAEESSVWLSFIHSAAVGLGAAGAASLAWLLLRRKRDVYGRDYYVFAVQYCARWAFVSTIAGLIISAVLIWRILAGSPPGLTQTPPLVSFIVGYGFPLLCCVIWGVILLSTAPLRHKPGMVGACVLLLCAIYAQITAFTFMLPMP